MFEHPIPLPGGKNLVTLQDDADYITSLPEKETDLSEWQVAMKALCRCRKVVRRCCPGSRS